MLYLVAGAFVLLIALSSDSETPLVANQSLWELEFQTSYEELNDFLSSSGFFYFEQRVFQSGSALLLKSANFLNKIAGTFTSTDSLKGGLLTASLRILFFVVLFAKFSFLSLIAGFFIARPLIRTYRSDNPFGLSRGNRIFDFAINLSATDNQLPSYLFPGSVSSYKTRNSGIYRLLQSKKLNNQLNADLLSISLYSDERVDLSLFEVFLRNYFLPEDTELGKAIKLLELGTLRQSFLSSFVLATAAADSIFQNSEKYESSSRKLFLMARVVINSIPEAGKKAGSYDLNYLKAALASCANQGLQAKQLNKAEIVKIISFGNLLYDFISGTEISADQIALRYRSDMLLAHFGQAMASSLRSEDKAAFRQLTYNKSWIAVALTELVDFFESDTETDLSSFQNQIKSLKPEEQIEARQQGYSHNIAYDKMAAWIVYSKLFSGYAETLRTPEICLSIRQSGKIINGQVIFSRSILSQFIEPAEYAENLYSEFEAESSEKSTAGRQNLFFLMR